MRELTIKSFQPASTSPPSTTTAASLEVSSPSPEQLVARIRALVRALRDADQLLKALQTFREQQQLDDEAVLRIMKEDANRTLVQQVEQAQRAFGGAMTPEVAAMMANITAWAPSKHLSAKVPYSAYGKKSAKFAQGQGPSLPDVKAAPAVGKPRSGVAAAASVKTTAKPKAAKPTTATRTPAKTATLTASSVFSARTTTNGTVITRVKKDPILGEYKVVIRDLTPAASSGIAPRNGSAAISVGEDGGKDSKHGTTANGTPNTGLSLFAPVKWLLPPVTGTPPSSERGRYKFQDTLAAPSSTAATAPAASSTTPPAANRRSGKAAPHKSPRAKPREAAPKGKVASTPRPVNATTNNTTTTNNNNATSSKPAAKKSFQKKAADTQQVRVSATLRTAPPAEREEASAREKAPLETPLLSGIFPRYGPGATLPQVEIPFVPTAGRKDPPAEVLLPPLPDKNDAAPMTPSPVTSSSPPSPSSPPLPPAAPAAPVASALPLTWASSTPPAPSTTSSAAPPARDDERSAAGGGGPQETVRLEAPLTPSLQDVPASYFLGESPWIPIFVPSTAAPAASSKPQDTAPPPSRTVVEFTKLNVVEATPAPFLASSPSPGPGAPQATPQGRAVLNDALEWRPSRTWQFAVRQDRVDANLQDLQQDSNLQAQLQHLRQLQLQLQPDLRLSGGLLPLSVAESMFYRVRPGQTPGDLLGDAATASAYDGIPGVPGMDYPAFSRPPSTRFTCADFGQKGYFADPASGCQAFYVCHGDGRGEAMLCPNGTIFSQEVLVCDWWFNVDCK
ncbi:proteoglycan 4-like [Thrips palmi]|uniref:Proteoglycan 4-like n=1 Tax=Thrips palmi TaxID=161013 RepID=A0A6P9A755_THRPL|nr:proteoglycan 4-like [Thrips palmi]